MGHNDPKRFAFFHKDLYTHHHLRGPTDPSLYLVHRPYSIVFLAEFMYLHKNCVDYV